MYKRWYKDTTLLGFLRSVILRRNSYIPIDIILCTGCNESKQKV
jgi:hypothetical protein